MAYIILPNAEGHRFDQGEAALKHFAGRVEREVMRRQFAAGVNADSAEGAAVAATLAKIQGQIWREDTIRAANQALRDSNVRADSASATGGTMFADQTTAIFNEVMREARPVLNGLKLFPKDSRVKLGQRSFEFSRIWADGEAAWYRAGEGIPRAGYSKVTQRFNVAYAITSVVYDMFEEMAAGIANEPLIREMMTSARDALETFANNAIWNGDDTVGIYGILNYPWLSKQVLATDFTDAEHTSSGGQAILDELLALVERAGETSKGVFRPNCLAMTQRTINFLASKPLGTASAYRDSTILEKFKVLHPEVKIIEGGIWELENAGGSNVDGILAFNDTAKSVAAVMVGGGIQTLPLQIAGFERVQPMFMGLGGVVMRDVGNNILGFVTVDA